MLPIDTISEEIKAAVAEPGFCVLLSAPTGSGKSTRVPRMLVDAGCAARGCILVVQPRRLAARLLAAYVAAQFPCALGDEVGYRVRFDARCSERTRILFTTDGLLERRLTDDPELRGVSAVIFDEVHERRLSGDLCLARVLELLPPGEQHRKEYETMLVSMCKALKPLQREDGFWNVSLHDPSNYGGKELTGTAMFAYGMAYGVNHGLLDADEFAPVIYKAWNAMVKDCLHPNGFLGYVQGTGKEPTEAQPVTYDREPDFDDYGLGAFLMAGAEITRMK